ncbi:MAG: guanylate kinase [candidate division WOR-3 bacterium]|nr:guanylate kinase [candidate division WOR-3 bacterium]
MTRLFNVKRKSIIFVLASPSAAGKTTLCYAAKARDKNIWYSISVTTRPKRPKERNGREYYFVTEQEFNQLLKSGGLLEHTKIYDARYGTPKKPIEEKLQQGKDVIMDLDVKGVKALKRFWSHTVSIYILPPSMEELWLRLKNRDKGSWEQLQKRFASAEKEMKVIPQFDYLIINKNLKQAIDDLLAIIRAERLKVSRLVL